MNRRYFLNKVKNTNFHYASFATRVDENCWVLSVAGFLVTCNGTENNSSQDGWMELITASVASGETKFMSHDTSTPAISSKNLRLNEVPPVSWKKNKHKFTFNILFVV